MEIQHTEYTIDRLAPGPLYSETSLTLHTLYAWQLVHGRAGAADQPSITGLLNFASSLKPIWTSARKGSAEAAENLVEVDDEIELAKRRLRSVRADLDTLAESILGIGYTMPVSARPVSISLKFLVPQAYRAARLLAEFDQIMCWRSVLARSQALSGTQSYQFMRHSGRSMRRMLSTVVRLGSSTTQVPAESQELAIGSTAAADLDLAAGLGISKAS